MSIATAAGAADTKPHGAKTTAMGGSDTSERKRSTIRVELAMKRTFAFAVAVAFAAALSVSLVAQEEKKPVPKDSVRVSIPGCSKGYVFTAARRTSEEAGSADIPEGMHLRMNGPKKLMTEIKAHEGQLIQITGLMKKGQYAPGVGIGGGVRVMPGSSPTGGGSMSSTPVMANQPSIDIEGWRPAAGDCPSR
jgi:hypothetical protein